MNVYLSDKAHKDLQMLFRRSVYLTDRCFCKSFVSFCKTIGRDLLSLENGKNSYSVQDGMRLSKMTAIQVAYKVFPYAQSIVIYSIWFIGLRRLYSLCAYERRIANTRLGRRPTQIKASTLIADYQDTPKGDGGQIKGIPVRIVQRKGVTTPSGKPLFNYLWNGRIISKIDFLSCNPFTLQNGKEKASAYGANGKKYWVLPSGRRLLYCSVTKLKKLITETVRKRLYENRLMNIIKESVRQALKETLNEKTQLEHRSIGRRKPNRVRNV